MGVDQANKTKLIYEINCIIVMYVSVLGPVRYAYDLQAHKQRKESILLDAWNSVPKASY